VRNKVSPGEYLAFLSIKYDVDPDRLFGAIISAGENQKSMCGKLSIECRSKQQDKTVLLIMNDQKVVAQFPVPKGFLMKQSNPIKNVRRTDMIRRQLIKKDNAPHTVHIGDLRSGMKRVTLQAKVQEIAKPTLVFTRFGNYASVANALIADETGTIKLCLWNEQITSVSAGDNIQIKNASMAMFRGEKQLRVGRKGIISNVEDMNLPKEVNCP
jgi:replication factor A1